MKITGIPSRPNLAFGNKTPEVLEVMQSKPSDERYLTGKKRDDTFVEPMVRNPNESQQKKRVMFVSV